MAFWLRILHSIQQRNKLLETKLVSAEILTYFDDFQRSSSINILSTFESKPPGGIQAIPVQVQKKHSFIAMHTHCCLLLLFLSIAFLQRSHGTSVNSLSNRRPPLIDLQDFSRQIKRDFSIALLVLLVLVGRFSVEGAEKIDEKVSFGRKMRSSNSTPGNNSSSSHSNSSNSSNSNSSNSNSSNSLE